MKCLNISRKNKNLFQEQILIITSGVYKNQVAM